MDSKTPLMYLSDEEEDTGIGSEPESPGASGCPGCENAEGGSVFDSPSVKRCLDVRTAAWDGPLTYDRMDKDTRGLVGSAADGKDILEQLLAYGSGAYDETTSIIGRCLDIVNGCILRSANGLGEADQIDKEWKQPVDLWAARRLAIVVERLYTEMETAEAWKSWQSQKVQAVVVNARQWWSELQRLKDVCSPHTARRLSKKIENCNQIRDCIEACAQALDFALTEAALYSGRAEAVVEEPTPADPTFSFSTSSSSSASSSSSCSSSSSSSALSAPISATSDVSTDASAVAATSVEPVHFPQPISTFDSLSSSSSRSISPRSFSAYSSSSSYSRASDFGGRGRRGRGSPHRGRGFRSKPRHPGERPQGYRPHTTDRSSYPPSGYGREQPRNRHSHYRPY